MARKTVAEDPRLTRLRRICAAMPEAEHTQNGRHADFRVRKRVFAYFLDDHHGDGVVSVCVKAQPGENEDRAQREPERYFLPAYIGSRGWFGLYLDRGPIDWDDVTRIVRASYLQVAPKTLARQLS